jgi:hypothetical protein
LFDYEVTIFHDEKPIEIICVRNSIAIGVPICHDPHVSRLESVQITRYPQIIMVKSPEKAILRFSW